LRGGKKTKRPGGPGPAQVLRKGSPSSLTKRTGSEGKKGGATLKKTGPAMGGTKKGFLEKNRWGQNTNPPNLTGTRFITRGAVCRTRKKTPRRIVPKSPRRAGPEEERMRRGGRGRRL